MNSFKKEGRPSSQKVYLWKDPIVGMAFVRVPWGHFMMGSNFGYEREKPVHEVCLDDFWMGQYPVTINGYRRFLLETGDTRGVDLESEHCPINPDENFSIKENRFGRDGRRPMVEVSWEGAQAFAAWLRQASGKAVHLPTEAQWEYAARSGGRNESYAGGNDLDELGWYYDNADGRTHPVGKKAPNRLGIYDMSGNVWEWCEDVFDRYAYSRSRAENPLVTSGSPYRAGRGGSWAYNNDSSRCTHRSCLKPTTSYYTTGFRLVRNN